MHLPLRSQDDVEQVMLRIPQVANIQHWSKLYSSEAHLAGDLPHATRIRNLWRSYGISTELVRYDVLQNFPKAASLKLLSPEGKVSFEASLTEDELPEDPTSSPKNGYPAFHGFSANGNVTAALVYANFGRLADFELLEKRGISVKGKIVICKYAKVFRGLKVRAAEKFGAVGVIIYNDPQEDGQYTTKNGYAHYPHGPARHPSSIQRGSVDFFSVSVGDPSTPGYPSLPGNDTIRKNPGHAIPGIPSLPISFADALPLLKALNGYGLSPYDIGGPDGEWQGELEGVDYFTGPSQVKVSLLNEGIYRYSPIYNVIGTISGTTEESIVLGNHHDSWCCGAVDPVSGSAAMNEVARGLGTLLSMGWKPYRKLILASWDNEEYGLVGSTEWGEDNAQSLTENCVAYLNVDESTNGGSVLGATGSPLLTKALREVTTMIPSPKSENKTVYDDWLEDAQLTHPDLDQTRMTVMGTGSDYTVFYHHLGVPSVDLLFNRQGKGVYPYHSNYDSYYWLENFGDVGFKKHYAMTQLWGVLAVKLAGVSVVQFEATEYAHALKGHVALLEEKAGDCLNYSFLKEAITKFHVAAQKLDEEAQTLLPARDADLDDSSISAAIASVNERYMKIERMFLSKGTGLPDRNWFKHIIFAPGLWEGYDGVAFPGILESLENNNIHEANHWVEKIANAIEKVANTI